MEQINFPNFPEVSSLMSARGLFLKLLATNLISGGHFCQTKRAAPNMGLWQVGRKKVIEH